MQKIKRKAVSSIVATASILLLTIVLVSIISLTFNQILATPKLAPALSCIEMQAFFPLQIQKTCFNPTTNKTEVTVKRKLDTAGITEFDFLLTTPTETSKWCVGEFCCEECNLQAEGQIKTYFLNQTLDMNQNNKAGIVLNNCLIQTKNIISC